MLNLVVFPLGCRNVVGTARSEEKRDALQAKGFQVFDFAPDEYELLG